MKNFSSKADTVNVTPTSQGLGGAPILVGAMPCIPVSDYAANETVAASVEGAFDCPKAAVNITVGQLLFLTPAGMVTNVEASGTNKKCGFALNAAASGVAKVLVKWAI